MRNIILLFTLFLFLSCKNNPPKIIQTDDYELIIPNNPKSILILFPGFNGDAKRIKQQSKIPIEAIDNNIAVMLFNSYNHHLFLYDDEKNNLEELISTTLKVNQLENKNIFLGGFSSGGNVTLLIANQINAKGIFIIDAPVDLANFYFRCQKKLQNNDGEITQFPKYFYELFNSTFGNPNEDISLYENYSPYTSATNFTYNIDYPKDMSIRLYTEPDLEFYQKIFNDFSFSDLNTPSIKKMYEDLKNNGHTDIKYIETTNKGFRADRTRSPHSWSIADEKEIVKWILKNN
ncbi:MAG: hypothetical protein L3J14_04405 [Flavobacteriaceae bacterium]|nr:hypothetical protein [Flavobacteriaceae bacterium]